jgi:hypothetical protein
MLKHQINGKRICEVDEGLQQRSQPINPSYKLDFISIKNCCSLKGTIIKGEGQTKP